MSIHISEPTLKDKAQWETLYYGYATFYKVTMNQEILDNVWAWIMDVDHGFYGLLAKDETSQCVCFMLYRAMPSPLRGKMVGFLDDLFVEPKCRGNGVVEALYEALNRSAKDKGWPFMRWITADNNYRGRGVYDKLSQRTHWITYQMQVDA